MVVLIAEVQLTGRTINGGVNNRGVSNGGINNRGVGNGGVSNGVTSTSFNKIQIG